MQEDLRLPIYALETDLIRELSSAQRCRVVLSAPTGSGKSTQVPQMVLDGVFGGSRGGGDAPEIVVLQPRRIAARLLAARVAAERGGRLGEEVGYQVRLDSCAGPRTRIRYVTEGVLLRRILGDSALRGVGAVLFDEFHERHLYGDVTLGRILQLQETGRPDLKIVVMSATLDGDALEKFLQPCRRLESSGRTFSVEIVYRPSRERQKKAALWERAAEACEWAVVEQRQDGDVLVFMPGGYEIRRTIDCLQRASFCRGWKILPLYGDLPPGQQDEAVKRYRERKIIVATNVAETSLTIDGVRIVVDSGLARMANFDPHRGINTLTVDAISRASADQRAGRAGRTAPGLCVRLWPEREHAARPAREDPEIARVDLSEVILTLKAQGIAEVREFRWLDIPEEKGLSRAENLLEDLGATDAGAITGTGRRMLAFPLHPRFARMLVAAEQYGSVREACLIAALAQGREIFLKQKSRGSDLTREDYVRESDVSDFQALLRGLESAHATEFRGERCGPLGLHGSAAREAWRLALQFMRIAERNGLGLNVEAAPVAAVAKTILAGFADQVGCRTSQGSQVYQLVHGRRGRLGRESVARSAPLVAAVEVAEIEGKELQVLLTKVTALESDWLQEVFPGHFTDATRSLYDAPSRRVMARRETRFRDLVIAEKSGGEPSDEEAAVLLAAEVLKGELKLKQWDQAVEQWIIRLQRLSEWMPELQLPGFDEGDRRALIEHICLGARSYREIRDRPVWPSLKKWLSAGQQQCLDTYAPERIDLSNGRTAKVIYQAGGPPAIAVLIQNLYGVDETPRLAGGRIPVRVDILAPNHRPIQMTEDLRSFWKTGYPEVKKQLQGRYPRHEWR